MAKRSQAQSGPSPPPPPPPHPGFVLLEHHMKPHRISQREAAARLGIDPAEVSRFVNGLRDVDAHLALNLAELTQTDAHYWLRLQADYDVWREQAKKARSAGPKPASSPPPAAEPPKSLPDLPAHPSHKKKPPNSRSDPGSAEA